MAATVTINCSSNQSVLDRYEQYNNASYKEVFVTTKFGPGDQSKVANWDTKILRVWIFPTPYSGLNAGGYWDRATDTYNYSAYYNYLDLASNTADHLMVTTGAGIAEDIAHGLYTPEKLQEVLKNGLKHYKQRYPKIRYVEAGNEYTSNLSDSDYYEKIYKIHYRVLNDINSELGLNSSNRLLLGGPVIFRFDHPTIPDRREIQAFIANFKNDSSADKLLDFISYHQYLTVSGHDRPTQLVGERSKLSQWLPPELDPNLPAFVTEIGNQSPDNSGLPLAEKHFIQAAGMASVLHWYQDEHNITPLNWCIHHRVHPYKDQFYSTDGHLAPYGKLLQALSLMKITRVSASSTQLDSRGIGVYGLASKDSSGVTVLAWNYQWNQSVDHYTTVTVNNLPNEFNGKCILLRRFAIDRANDENPSLDHVEETVFAYTGSFNHTFFLHENELQLLELTPTTNCPIITFAELEDLTPVTSGASYDTIDDSNFSGGKGQVLRADSVGDFIQYTLSLPSSGEWDIRVRVKKWKPRGIFQLKLPQEGNANVGGPVDNYSSSVQYTEVDVGNYTFASAGNQQFRFEIVGKNPASNDYKIVLDYIKLIKVGSSIEIVEVESLTPTVMGATFATLDDSNFSGGQGQSLRADSTGDYIQYTLNVPSSGEWNITVRVKKWKPRGIFQLKLPQQGNANVGGPVDTYSPSVQYAEMDVGNYTFSSAGNQQFRFEIVGKNSSSTGYYLVLDYIKLTKQ